MLRTSKTSKWGSAARISTSACLLLSWPVSAVFQCPDLQLGQIASIPAVLHYTSPPYSSPTRLTQAYPCKAKNAPDVPWYLKSVGPKWGTITLHHPIPCTEAGHGVTQMNRHKVGSCWVIHTYTVLSHRGSLPCNHILEGYLLMKLANGFTWIFWGCLLLFYYKKAWINGKTVTAAWSQVCLFWFAAPFTWPNSLICWCLQSCFECVTTSVTSSGYCETFVKTAFIKPLLNRETETLLLVISCSPAHLSVEDFSWDFLSSMNSSRAPLKAKELLLLTLVGFGSAPWEQFWHLNVAGRQQDFSLCASYSCV